MEKNLIQVAPGIYIDPVERRDMQGKAMPSYEVLDDVGLARICLRRSQMRTLLRLEHAGCIRLIKFAPRRFLIDLDSWQQHLKACQSNPEFWERPEMQRRYKIAKQAV